MKENGIRIKKRKKENVPNLLDFLLFVWPYKSYSRRALASLKKNTFLIKKTNFGKT